MSGATSKRWKPQAIRAIKALRAMQWMALNQLHVPHLHPHKIKVPRAEKFVKHLNAKCITVQFIPLLQEELIIYQ